MEFQKDTRIPFICLHNINPRLHFNNRGLCLNDKGLGRLAQDFKEFLINTK